MKENLKIKLFSIATVLISFSCIFIFCEVFIRIFAQKDKDNNYFLGYSPLLPVKLPINEMKSRINKYNNFTDESWAIYDSILGWLPNQNNYIINDEEITYNNIPISKKRDVLRIAIFGDSFSVSAEVDSSNSWERILLSNLENFGIDVEILNFGVSGYGMDQAYLRWHNEGKLFSPDIVLFGFQPDNIKRNVNLIRPFMNMHTTIPFTKPRFIINEKGNLSLVNSPTVPLNNIISLISNISSWDLLKYEHFYSDELFFNNFLFRSKVLGIINKIINKLNLRYEELEFYSLKNEASQVTLKIIDQFKRETEQENANFIIIHFPPRSHLISLNKGLGLTYSDIFHLLSDNYNIIDPTKNLLELIRENGIDSIAKGHYTKLGYYTIGSITSQYILNNLDSLYSDLPN